MYSTNSKIHVNKYSCKQVEHRKQTPKDVLSLGLPRVDDEIFIFHSVYKRAHHINHKRTLLRTSIDLLHRKQTLQGDSDPWNPKDIKCPWDFKDIRYPWNCRDSNSKHKWQPYGVLMANIMAAANTLFNILSWRVVRSFSLLWPF
eukprot:GHVU01070628.1.p1 GENE.GHVU01070628.1~~GHVU01070628.1.p1  ORF type:complete len:145 (+),score=1.84 GHVU01070628.1:264-698(+)